MVVCATSRVQKTESGFTLVEILLYLAIAGSVLLVVSSLTFLLLKARVRNQGIAEVQQQGSFTMATIMKNLRQARGINYPLPGQNGQQLSLDMYDASSSPLTFDGSGSAITESRGGGTVFDLTSPKVVVSNFSFANLGRPGTGGVIRVSFTLQYQGAANYDYSADFYNAAEINN